MSLSAAELSDEEAFEIGQDAYIFGYPLVTMDITRQVIRIPLRQKHPRSDGAVPLNAKVSGCLVQDVTAPNADTLYSPLGSTSKGTIRFEFAGRGWAILT